MAEDNGIKQVVQNMLNITDNEDLLDNSKNTTKNAFLPQNEDNEYIIEEVAQNEDRLLNNHQISAINKNTSFITIPLVESVVSLKKGYTLDNIPDYCENASLQQYHFSYTPQQLREMYTSTKIIIDIHYNMFDTSNGKIQRTSFFAVAPHANNSKGIPSLYRFSVSVDLKNPEHYSISMYAIVGGKEDGWLFLGRLDNDTTPPHSFVVSEVTKTEVKRSNAVLTKGLTQAQKNIIEKYQKDNNGILHDLYCIPFPHMHKPSSRYEIGEKPEKSRPKFLRNCAYNNFEDNLQYMMKIFNISDQPHLRLQNDTIANIIKEEFKIIHINKTPNPYKLLGKINSGYRENRPKFIKEIPQEQLKPAKSRTIRADIFRSPKYKNKERKLLMRAYKYNYNK